MFNLAWFLPSAAFFFQEKAFRLAGFASSYFYRLAKPTPTGPIT